MKIIEPNIEAGEEEFICKCGCKFIAEKDEYYVERESEFSGITYKTQVTDVYVCSCPQCHKIVTKEKTRKTNNFNISSTYIANGNTYTNMYDLYPDVCEKCSNNPKNGGSGICNCILGLKDKVTCSTGDK